MYLNNQFNYQKSMDSYINTYLNTDCLIEKAEIAQELRIEFSINYQDLADLLFETERSLYRIMALNRLIPELKELLIKKKLKKLKAYALSSKSSNEQLALYYSYREEIIKAKNDVFMQVVSKVAKELKTQPTIQSNTIHSLDNIAENSDKILANENSSDFLR